MKSLNNTHYHTLYSMVYNTFPDPDSFNFESSRRDSFYQRLFYEYQYTKSVGGFTFFYTLTYNDKSIPTLFGKNTFSYKDIRYVTNGSLVKTLLRKYSAKLRYFCACERGEGKGVRGIGNNPHYHFIFFVTPIGKFNDFTSDVFDKLIKELWQGSFGYIRFQNAKFGIVKAGKFGNVVVSSEAFKYVSKYVTKSSESKDDFIFFSRKFYDIILKRGIDYTCFYRYYLWCKVQDPSLTRDEFFSHYRLSSYNLWKRNHPSYSSTEALNTWLRDFCTSYNKDTSSRVPIDYISLKNWFDEVYIPAILKESMSYFNTEFSDKPRYSKSLGIYGLQFIRDVDSSPHFVIPSSDNVYTVSPCLYYQRKLYYNVVKCPKTGNVLYRLNDLGVKYRMNTIERRIDRTYQDTLSNIDFVIRNDVFIPYFKSDFKHFDLDSHCSFLPIQYDSVEDSYSYKDFLDSLCKRADYDRLIRLYSIYKCVYQYRSFDNSSFIALSTDLDISDVKKDYLFFLTHQYSELDDFSLSLRLVRYRDSISFSSFYLFYPYIDIFNFLDSLNDTVNGIISEQRKQSFRERSDFIKLHSANKASLS